MSCGVDPKRVRLSRGRACDCHGNASRLWLKHPDRLSIVTGYALSYDDPMWLRHTWAYDNERRQVIETTTPRQLYFGTVLPNQLAARFAAANDR